MNEAETQVLYPISADGDDDFDDDARDPAAAPPAGSSVLAALKQQRARVAEPQTFDVVVPGWNELLVLRLGSITGQQQQRIVERARATLANVDVDFIVAAFRYVLGRATPQGELEVLADPDGDPVGLDKRVADMLDLGPVRSAREVVELLFARANSPTLAISSAANEWLEWGRGANTEIDETFVGE